MTAEQWTTLVGQLGTAGGVIFVLSKMVFPMVLARMDTIVAAQKELTAAIDRLVAVTGTNAERLARLEGIFDHAPDAKKPPRKPG